MTWLLSMKVIISVMVGTIRDAEIISVRTAILICSISLSKGVKTKVLMLSATRE